MPAAVEEEDAPTAPDGATPGIEGNRSASISTTQSASPSIAKPEHADAEPALCSVQEERTCGGGVGSVVGSRVRDRRGGRDGGLSV
eukprot:1498268-Rhodomonas_salina.1